MINPIQNVKDQFKTPKVGDFPNVLIPLSDSQRSHSMPGAPVRDVEKRPSGAESPPSDTSGPSPGYDLHTIDALRSELDNEATAFGSNSVYNRKSKLINIAIQDMGMGIYQWQLFVLCGFGWFADNLWLQGIALTLQQAAFEFGIGQTHIRFTTLSLFLGLTIGACFWGVAADVIGRRLAFNTTLFICALFGTAAGAAPNFIGLSALAACMGLGVGGNLPVDGALFLEFLPFASGSLLTGLSVWWPVGSLVGAMVAWGLVPNFACSGYHDCTSANNMGWRYLLYTLGGVTFLQWGCRFLLFHLYESPKFLLARGRQAEAVAVIHAIAHKNGKTTWLTEEIMNDLGGSEKVQDEKLGRAEMVKDTLSKFSVQRVGPLFGNWKIGLTTVLLWFQWACLGMGYPLFNAFLPQYIAENSPSVAITYRNYAITNVVGVPGSIAAIWLVNVKYLGRKGTMALSTMLAGIMVILFTTSKDPNIQLALSSLEALFQNVAYGVLYAYTPEVFPAPQRGTGTGFASTFNRIAGLCAPLVAIYGGTSNPVIPIYASGALFLAASVSMVFLPIETRGKQSL